MKSNKAPARRGRERRKKFVSDRDVALMEECAVKKDGDSCRTIGFTG